MAQKLLQTRCGDGHCVPVAGDVHARGALAQVGVGHGQGGQGGVDPVLPGLGGQLLTAALERREDRLNNVSTTPVVLLPALSQNGVMV